MPFWMDFFSIEKDSFAWKCPSMMKLYFPVNGGTKYPDMDAAKAPSFTGALNIGLIVANGGALPSFIMFAKTGVDEVISL